MSFDTKKMIIATIIVGIVFVLFLGYAFNNIQKVDIDIEILDDEAIDAELQKIADTIIDKHAVEYVDNISLDDIDMDILLVNHQRKSACIIKEQSMHVVNYDKLDKSIIYCNSFVVVSDKKKTMIINCDEILGNPAVMAIANAYHYEFASTDKLSPDKVECFQTTSQDETISFYRYAMIESAEKSCFDGLKLDDFYYFYDQWTYFKGMNNYQEVVNYDYYDGFKAFVSAKVMVDLDDNFNLREYIHGYKNDYGIYSKDNESEVMGMLWCFLMEKQGKQVVLDETSPSDIYKILLDGIPQGHVDDNDLRNDYNRNYSEYMDFVENTINKYRDDMNQTEPVVPIITAEKYSGTIKVEENHYIYIDYIARDDNNELLKQDYVLAELTPYTIKFFFGER